MSCVLDNLSHFTALCDLWSTFANMTYFLNLAIERSGRADDTLPALEVKGETQGGWSGLQTQTPSDKRRWGVGDVGRLPDMKLFMSKNLKYPVLAY